MSHEALGFDNMTDALFLFVLFAFLSSILCCCNVIK